MSGEVPPIKEENNDDFSIYDKFYKKIEDFLVSIEKEKLLNSLDIKILDNLFQSKRNKNLSKVKNFTNEIWSQSEDKKEIVSKFINNNFFIKFLSEEMADTLICMEDQSDQALKDLLKHKGMINRAFFDAVKTYFSYRDEKTNLWSNQAFEELTKNLAEENQTFIIAIIDIDKFKRINDSFLYQVGDETIKSLAQAFKKSLEESALSKKTVLARKGGDEFILTLVKDENRSMEEFKGDLLEFFYNVTSNLKKYIKKNPLTPEDEFLENISYSLGLVKYPKTEKEKIEQEKQAISTQELVNLANEILKINKKNEDNNQIPMTIAIEIFKSFKIYKSSS